MDVIPSLRAATTKGTAEANTTPIATVSGIASTNAGMIAWFDTETSVAVITTKSIQIEPNPGNREPIIVQPRPGCFGNAVGLKNPGVEEAVTELSALRSAHRMRAYLNVSISADSADDFVFLARRVAAVADMIEMNYSCPHATSGYGADIGRDERAIATITAAVIAAVPGTPVLVKLTPNVPDIASMATVAVESGAAGIVAINTVGPAVYRHLATGTPILSNPPDGRGGMSGRWIATRARSAVSAIRSAVGPKPLIIGMGGIATRGDVAAMRAAGADVVGVGSSLAEIHQRDWPSYLDELSGTAPHEPQAQRASVPMNYVPHEVLERRELGDDLFELELSGALTVRPGQALFLWIPGIGEKPFAPSLDAPLTFLVKRRGTFTEALGRSSPGDVVYHRGPYGDPFVPSTAGPALLVGAGSGIAALPPFAESIVETGGSVATLVAVRSSLHRGRIEDTLRSLGSVQIVPDDGTPGRALAELPRIIAEESPTTVFIVGPEAFMRSAADVVAATDRLAPNRTAGPGDIDVSGNTAGAPATFVSLEQPMRCGIGLCGECHNNGILTCRHGTIVSAERWRKR